MYTYRLFNQCKIVQVHKELKETFPGKRLTDRQRAIMFNLDSTVGAGQRKVGAVCAVSKGHCPS